MGRLWVPTLNNNTTSLDYKDYTMNSVICHKQKNWVYLIGNKIINVWNEKEKCLNKQIKTRV